MEDVKCPICSLNLQVMPQRKREEHCDACLDGLDEEINSTERIDLPETIKDSEPETVNDGCINEKEAVDLTKAEEIEVTKEEIKEESKQEDKQQEINQEVTKVETKQIKIEPTPSGLTKTTKLLSPKPEPSQKVFKPASKESRLSPMEPPAKRTKSMPFFKTITLADQKIAVDAFNYGAIPGVNAYYLSHFHSDHYGGLSKKWTHGPIYCSLSTARLVSLKLGVSDAFIKPLAMNEAQIIDGVEVVLLDANHCPGAVVFIFNRQILHTGDFRATSDLARNLKQWTPKLDAVYLDTTYLDPVRKFPDQGDVVALCAEFCRKFQLRPQPRNFFYKSPAKRRILVLVGSYTIGKERLALAIASQLGTTIWASSWKQRVLRALDWPEFNDLVSSDPVKSQVHLVAMGEVTKAKLEEKWKKMGAQFTHMLAFVPTGWTWPASATTFEESMIDNPQNNLAGYGDKIRICRVPYSEHSSYTELEQFCKSVHCRKLIATVSTKRYDILRSWEAR